MYKLALTTVVFGTFLGNIQPAPAACHKYSTWNYPFPQKCGGVAARGRALKDASYYVEITEMPNKLIPPVDVTIPLPVLEPLMPKPADLDLRTPEEIEDQVEHDQAVGDHKDTINKLMIILHAVEGNIQ